MYPVLELARYVVVKCIEDRCPISNLQLQKILYYIQREFLRVKGSPAFPEYIEAWPFGPVIPDVYYYFCGAGSMPITLCDMPDKDVVNSFSREEQNMIDSIVENKRLLDPWDLVAETHKNGGAWDIVYNKGYGNREIITPEQIKELG